MANERLDFVIFGATGFTGKQAVKVAAQLAKEKQIKFGVSGRRKQALETIVKECAPDVEDVPIIIADLKDEESLKKMTAQAKVLVNCCGPYRFYGEPVIKACIETRTHQVDVTGEPQFMETIQLKYNKAAEEAGIYIISACGFDCIPCDLGVIFTQDKFDGDVNSIESYLKYWVVKKVKSASAHYATYESAVYSVANYKELFHLRKQLYPERLPLLGPKIKRRNIIHKSPLGDGWSIVFPAADRSVVQRSQRYLYEKCKQRPTQIQTYVTWDSFWNVLAIALLSVIFYLMTQFEFGRNLLLKYPEFFTAGNVSHEGPTQELMDNSRFSITFRAEGWTEKLADPSDKHKEPPNKVLITRVSSASPGYGATCIMALLAAITIVKESDKMPDNGGVLAPGAAFGKTSLLEELNQKDIKFEVLSSIET